MMPKMYCITCPQIPWRRTAAAERFRAAGLDVELFDGLHGPTTAIVPQLGYFEKRDHLISPGKVGLTLSKLLLWTLAHERPDEEVLIFEDDAIFVPNFREEFARSCAALPADWEVAHVGHCCTEGKPVEPVNDRVSVIRYPLCCHAVLWKRHALREAIAGIKRASLSSHSDIILSRTVYPKLRHYTFTPGLVHQDNRPGDGEAVKVVTPESIHGWFDFATLYDEALDRAHKPAVFVEIGSFLGKSTAYMAQEIKRRLKPVTFYAVDPWKATGGSRGVVSEVERAGGDLFPEWQRNMSRCGVIDYVTPLQMPSVEAAGRFQDGTVDFVFVDGDHSYEGCLADIKAWLPKLKPGGVMAGHDKHLDGVPRAIRETFGTKYRTWENCWIKD